MKRRLSLPFLLFAFAFLPFTSEYYVPPCNPLEMVRGYGLKQKKNRTGKETIDSFFPLSDSFYCMAFLLFFRQHSLALCFRFFPTGSAGYVQLVFKWWNSGGIEEIDLSIQHGRENGMNIPVLLLIISQGTEDTGNRSFWVLTNPVHHGFRFIESQETFSIFRMNHGFCLLLNHGLNSHMLLIKMFLERSIYYQRNRCVFFHIYKENNLVEG